MIKGKLLWGVFWSILQPSICVLRMLTYFLVCDCGLWKFVSNLISYYELFGDRGSTVVKVLCYKSEGRWFDSRLCHWNFL